MKAVIAIDSFKGSLTTFEAGEAVAEGVRRAYSDAEVFVSPIADGGEGTVKAIIAATNGKMHTVCVHGPLGEKIDAKYGIIESSGTAIIEMAEAAGITLINRNERNPLFTTTYGVGEMIADALKKGCRDFIIGIGGSATNDGGVGMLQALGVKFLDAYGKDIERGAIGLKSLSVITLQGMLPELKECRFCIACDVKNPLCGAKGCSAVYGPQKGATPEMITQMDGWLQHYAHLTKEIIPDSDASYAGTGAAGGMGFAFLAYLGGELKSGIDIVMEKTGLEAQVKDADVVVTGEGRLDGQSYMGKVPVGVAHLAKKYGKTVVAFSGCVTDDAVLCNNYGIDAFFSILRRPCSLEEAMDKANASVNLADTVEQVFKLIRNLKS